MDKFILIAGHAEICINRKFNIPVTRKMVKQQNILSRLMIYHTEEFL